MARSRRMEQDSTTNQMNVSKTIFPANRQPRKSLSFLENSLNRKSTQNPFMNFRNSLQSPRAGNSVQSPRAGNSVQSHRDGNSVQSPRAGKLETETSHNNSYSRNDFNIF